MGHGVGNLYGVTFGGSRQENGAGVGFQALMAKSPTIPSLFSQVKNVSWGLFSQPHHHPHTLRGDDTGEPRATQKENHIPVSSPFLKLSQLWACRNDMALALPATQDLLDCFESLPRHGSPKIQGLLIVIKRLLGGLAAYPDIY